MKDLLAGTVCTQAVPQSADQNWNSTKGRSVPEFTKAGDPSNWADTPERTPRDLGRRQRSSRRSDKPDKQPSEVLTTPNRFEYLRFQCLP